MQFKAETILDYISQLPEDRKEPISKLRNIINQNIGGGFEEVLSYNMPGWVVPHSLYPDGYHCDPKLPLPFLGIALPKTLYCSLSHGCLCQSKTSGMVYQ